MKKFLIFLVSIVVVVCIGLTTFYFMKNDEIITIGTKEIYCNAGDTITLESLNIVRKKANRKTTFNYNAGGEAVESAIKFDSEKGYYIVNGETAGDVDLVISTSNSKYAKFTVKVHIGNGEKETPYYVFNETDLNKIGSDYGLSDYYQLMNDITLTESFKPIGYSQVQSQWVGFSGGFNGNAHTISGMNLSGEYNNAGFFYSINATASVTGLKLTNATINGEYKNAGVLAGVVEGSVDRVIVENSTVTSTESNSYIGAFAGIHSNATLKMCGANNVTINVGTSSAVSNAVVGGFIGKVNKSTLQATYANNSRINIVDGSTGKFGGFAGEFVIDTDAGTIQQSYAHTVSENTNVASFIGEISKASGFAATNNQMIKFLIGNAAVKNNATNVVNTYDSSFFKTFNDTSKSLYLITSYNDQGELVIDSENLIFYAISSQNITLWDTTYVWEVSNSYLPSLRLGNVEPTTPSGDYFRKDLEQNEVSQTGKTFAQTFATSQTDKKFIILNDETLTDWTPVELKNCTIDGNGKTITVALSNASGDYLGLFSKIDNCTIKNLNIIVTGVSANAANVGAVAGFATSSDNMSSSTIENVKVTINSVSNITATNFGGIVGKAEKTTISNCAVLALEIDAQVKNVGGVVGELKETATIANAEVTATVAGTENVGGVVGINKGTVNKTTSINVIVNYNSDVADARVGGVAGNNEGVINGVEATAAININSAKNVIYVGGIAGENFKEISSSKVTGAGINVANISGVIYVGGITSNNAANSKIQDSQNRMTTVGTYNIGQNVKAAGIAAINAGSISKVVATSNVYGNYVAGVVVEMKNSSATIDQVLVGNYTNKKLTENHLKGDKYVAGIAVDLRLGKITNVQASSKIEGAANSTRSSLVVLIFPYGASLKNATISSSIGGYGTFYKETWDNFAAYNNKSEFGFSAGATGDDRFNLYANDTHHGSMQSVVIDSSKNGVSSARAAMGDAWAFSTTYTDSSESSFIKTVNGFTDISQFTGSFKFKCAESTTLGINHNAERTLTFAIGTTWQDNGSGISLIFLGNI